MEHNPDDKNLYIFTDGASRGNPGPGGYGAVLVFPMLDEVVELGGGKPNTTNNEMELTAAVSALSHAANNNRAIQFYTDSSYVVNGITKWIYGWQKNNWQTKTGEEVSHKQLWETLHMLVQSRGTEGAISWHTIPGHSGLPGNERADTIATEFADGKNSELYRGKLSDYPYDVLNISYDETKRQERSDKRKKQSRPAYSYLSLVDGKLERHNTWSDCEKRVKGTSGAKFKKATSKEDEEAIKKEWGVSE